MTDTVPPPGASLYEEKTAPATPPAGGDTPPPAGNTPPPAGQTPGEKTNEPPEGVPADFWDTEKKSIKSDELLKAYQQEANRAKGLRDKLAKGYQNVPEKPEEYGFELKPEGKEILGEAKLNDELIGLTKNAAKEAGLSKEQYDNFMATIVPELHKVSTKEKPEPTAEEAQAVADAWRKTESAKLGPNAEAIVQTVGKWAGKLKAQGVFTDSEFALVRDGMLATADGVRVLQKIKNLTTGDTHAGNGATTTSTATVEMTFEELSAATNNDARSWDPKAEAAAQEAITRWNKQEARKKR
jgi:hypothetical protein